MGEATCDLVGRIAPGSTAYVAGNPAITVAADPSKRGTRRIRVSGNVDAAVKPIIRYGGVNDQSSFTTVANEAWDLYHDISSEDIRANGYEIRFSGNCTILNLRVTEEQL